jgi:hypothetical protein
MVLEELTGDCLLGDDIGDVLVFELAVALDGEDAEPGSACRSESDVFVGIGCDCVCDSLSSGSLVDVDEVAAVVAALLEGHEAAVSEGEGSFVVVLVGADVEVRGRVGFIRCCEERL